jgi:hypothetical protein
LRGKLQRSATFSAEKLSSISNTRTPNSFGIGASHGEARKKRVLAFLFKPSCRTVLRAFDEAPAPRRLVNFLLRFIITIAVAVVAR